MHPPSPRLWRAGRFLPIVALAAVALLAAAFHAWADYVAGPNGASAGVFLEYNDGSGNPQLAGTSNPYPVSVQGAVNANVTGADATPATLPISAADVASTVTSGQSGQSIITGTPTASSAAAFAFAGDGAYRAQITGTWVGTIEFDISIDGGITWTPQAVTVSGTGTALSSLTGNGLVHALLNGATNVRARATAWTSGTATIRVVATGSTGLVGANQGAPNAGAAAAWPIAVAPQAASAFSEAAITITAGGNTAIVAAISAKTTKLYRLTLSCQNATTINLEDGSTVKMGPYYLGTGGSIVLDLSASGSPWTVGSANTALNINSSTAVNCGGSVSYIQS